MRRGDHCAAVAAERDRAAELVIGLGIGALHVVLLAPSRPRAGEHVHRSRLRRRVIVLLTVDPLAGTVLERRPERGGGAVGAQGGTRSEPVVGSVVGDTKS